MAKILNKLEQLLRNYSADRILSHKNKKPALWVSGMGEAAKKGKQKYQEEIQILV